MPRHKVPRDHLLRLIRGVLDASEVEERGRRFGALWDAARVIVEALVAGSRPPSHCDPDVFRAEVVLAVKYAVFRGLDTYAGTGSPSAWIRAITRNEFVEACRREKKFDRQIPLDSREIAQEDGDARPGLTLERLLPDGAPNARELGLVRPTPIEDLEETVRADVLLAALRILKNRSETGRKQAIILRAKCIGETAREIAVDVGESEDYVPTLFKRGCKALREILRVRFNVTTGNDI